MLVLGVAIMLVTVAGAPWIIRLLFGSRFDASVPVLMILAVAIPLRFVQHAYSSLFVSREDTGRRARYLGSAAAAGAATSVILVPSLGATGGAIGTVIAETVLLLLQVRGTTRFIGGIAVRDTFRWRTLRASWHRLTQPGAAAV
jgi:O-antigen/teichoic acid export membrane protein